jgi:hypothetical protein
VAPTRFTPSGYPVTRSRANRWLKQSAAQKAGAPTSNPPAWTRSATGAANSALAPADARSRRAVVRGAVLPRDPDVYLDGRTSLGGSAGSIRRRWHVLDAEGALEGEARADGVSILVPSRETARHLERSRRSTLVHRPDGEGARGSARQYVRHRAESCLDGARVERIGPYLCAGTLIDETVVERTQHDLDLVGLPDDEIDGNRPSREAIPVEVLWGDVGRASESDDEIRALAVAGGGQEKPERKDGVPGGSR